MMIFPHLHRPCDEGRFNLHHSYGGGCLGLHRNGDEVLLDVRRYCGGSRLYLRHCCDEDPLGLRHKGDGALFDVRQSYDEGYLNLRHYDEDSPIISVILTMKITSAFIALTMKSCLHLKLQLPATLVHGSSITLAVECAVSFWVGRRGLNGHTFVRWN